MTRRVDTVQASAAKTASGVIELGSIPSEFTELNIYLNITAVSGTTPSMTATYQASPDGVTWYDHTAGSAITAAANQLIKVSGNIGSFGRVSYAITGTTPSFTFSATTGAKRP